MILLGWFGVVSLREGEKRAARVFAAAAFTAATPLIAVAFLPKPFPHVVLFGYAVIGLIVGLRCLIPLHRSMVPGGNASRRVDERDIMFARGRLRPDSPEFDAYYQMRPENLSSDNHTRSLPGLLSPDAEKAEPLAFAAAEACFNITEALRDRVDGEVAPERSGDRTPQAWTEALKELALVWGAVDVGVAELEPAHVYTHIGRGTGEWGSEIRLDHRWALAFTVEMDHQAVAHAPDAPVVAESARQYVESAKIAIQLASVIRNHGWPARAHTDGNYRVIAPLVARAAGLGEIGRMGLLMTPRLGPRVRIGVVSTDLPLVPSTSGGRPHGSRFLFDLQEMRDQLPRRRHSTRRPRGHGAGEAMGHRRRNLLPILERRRHRLRHLHEGLPLFPPRQSDAQPRPQGHPDLAGYPEPDAVDG